MTAPIQEMTEGRAALIAGGWPLATIAARANVGRSVAQRWRQGLTRPDAASRARLNAEPFNIAADAWDRLHKPTALAAQQARPAPPQIVPGITYGHTDRVLVDALKRASVACEWPAVIALAEVLTARATQRNS